MTVYAVINAVNLDNDELMDEQIQLVKDYIEEPEFHPLLASKHLLVELAGMLQIGDHVVLCDYRSVELEKLTKLVIVSGCILTILG
ncbi:hypothetical protein [Dongshaea marina]|uniref:hypothetical protein n=1 Tax=Dongshaea marina TaxID=2047966 RepID=UPI000D3E0767|nr:hypothetical protein [Dongshaea marina]